MRRIMALWLPQLPLDRRIRQGDARAQAVFAIIAEIKNAFRLTHLSPAALEAGLRTGMSVPDARAVAPDLLTEPADPVREALLLGALARWAGRFSPWIAPHPPDQIIIDITGCTHLFGGEPAMASRLNTDLADMQITSRIGICDSKGGAQALARFGADRINIAPPGKTGPVLAPFPIAALGLPDMTTHDLHRTGLKTLGQLYNIKSSELARRFGVELPEALSKTLGHHPDPVCPQNPQAVFAARMNTPTPIGLAADVNAVLTRLCASVCRRLASAGKGGRRFVLTLRCVDSGDHTVSIGFARPTHDPAMILRQFERPLDAVTLEYGADWFRLEALDVEVSWTTQTDLDPEQDSSNVDMAQLVTTLGNRIGFDRVRRFCPGDSHVPDFEFTIREAALSQAEEDWPAPPRIRPARLFRPESLRTLMPGRPPRAFEWRRVRYDIAAFSGPERLYPEWWRRPAQAVRDYWIILTTGGERLWLMTYPHTRHPDWYVVGRFV